MEDSQGQDSIQNVTAIAEYDYVAKEDDEIDLLKGQIIHNISQKSSGWWEGTMASTGKRGMFPDNFVRLIENDENSMVLSRDKSFTAHRRYKAIYSYTRANEDELCLAVGDVIDFLTEVEEGWWKGRLNNKIGVFPSNFVVIIPNSPILPTKRPNFNDNAKATKSKAIKSSSSNNKTQTCSEENTINNKIIDSVFNKSVDDYRAPDLPPRPIKEFCRVEFPYNPQNDDELELVIGQIIAIVDKDLPDKGWWKGEVNGKTGVFPDNFVKLLPIEALEKDIPIQHSKLVANETTKKDTKSTIPTGGPTKGFESKYLPAALLKKKGIQCRNKAAQRMSLEDLNIELIKQSEFQDSKKSIQNVEEKKVPPPLPTKKPTISSKKTITNITGNVFSDLRQKDKNVEQKSEIYQDVNDGCIHSNKLYTESRSNIERTSGLDSNLGGDSEFDEVQRASILSDIRAGRVKAPKRRPPSVSTNLMTESVIKKLNLNNESEEVFHESETLLCTNGEEQVIPKSIEWVARKVPWMDELKASQIKMKSIPCIEPRTTLVNIKNQIKTEEEKTSISVNTNVSTKIIYPDNDLLLSKEKVLPKSSTSFYQSSSVEQNIESEAELSKSVSEINKLSVKDKFEDVNETNPPKSLHTKINVLQMKTEEVHETPDSGAQGKTTMAQLEQRVQRLEAIVQIQQELIEDLKKKLHDESSHVELVKNQLDKYAQCVTKV